MSVWGIVSSNLYWSHARQSILLTYVPQWNVVCVGGGRVGVVCVCVYSLMKRTLLLCLKHCSVVLSFTILYIFP